MTDLIGCFEENDAEAIEIALCEGDYVAVNQEGEDLAEIVADFAEFIPGLVGSKPNGNLFEIRFQNQNEEINLENCPSDEDRIRRAIRDAVRPEYEIRVLRSCLGSDTLAFVVSTPLEWQQIDKAFPHVATSLFTAFSDDIGFDVST